MWVLDASVATKWFFTDEPFQEKALEVRNSLIQGPSLFVVPSLFYSEMLHVLSRKSGKDIVFMNTAFDLLLRLGIRTLPLSKQAYEQAAKLCCLGFSGYDATYLALANEVNGYWLTADSQAKKTSPVERILLLNDWPGADK